MTLLAVSLGRSSADQAAQVRTKFRRIQAGNLRAGTVVAFTPAQLNAYALSELTSVVPQGIRQPRVELGNGTATGYAFIDFLRIQQPGQSSNVPWLIARLIEGERSVKVSTRIVSAGGKATVFLQRVEISGVGVSGGALDFLINEFFLPLYPGARINEPFLLGNKIERIEVTTAGASVVIGP